MNIFASLRLRMTTRSAAVPTHQSMDRLTWLWLIICAVTPIVANAA